MTTLHLSHTLSESKQAHLPGFYPHSLVSDPCRLALWVWLQLPLGYSDDVSFSDRGLQAHPSVPPNAGCPGQGMP